MLSVCVVYGFSFSGDFVTMLYINVVFTFYTMCIMCTMSIINK